MLICLDSDFQMTRQALLDGAIADVCNRSRMRPNPNSKAMAVALGLRLKPSAGREGGALLGLEVHYDRKLCDAQQQALVGRCLALYALRGHWLQNDPHAVSYVAAGLRQPRDRRRSGVLPLVGGGSLAG